VHRQCRSPNNRGKQANSFSRGSIGVDARHETHAANAHSIDAFDREVSTIVVDRVAGLQHTPSLGHQEACNCRIAIIIGQLQVETSIGVAHTQHLSSRYVPRSLTQVMVIPAYCIGCLTIEPINQFLEGLFVLKIGPPPSWHQ